MLSLNFFENTTYVWVAIIFQKFILALYHSSSHEQIKLKMLLSNIPLELL